jgi:hypothetical protein
MTGAGWLATRVLVSGIESRAIPFQTQAALAVGKTNFPRNRDVQGWQVTLNQAIFLRYSSWPESFVRGRVARHHVRIRMLAHDVHACMWIGWTALLTGRLLFALIPLDALAEAQATWCFYLYIVKEHDVHIQVERVVIIFLIKGPPVLFHPGDKTHKFKAFTYSKHARWA